MENTVSVALSRYPTFIFLALALLCSSLPAHAGPFLATLDDFHPNCDIRQLNLSADQHAALRRLRTDFKQINDKSLPQNRTLRPQPPSNHHQNPLRRLIRLKRRPRLC